MMTSSGSTERAWARLVGVGALIITGLLVLQGVVVAAPSGAEQGPVARIEDREMRVISAARGGRIGVAIADIDASADTDLDEGARVESVTSGSPAATAGFEEGDVVVEFDGERVRSARQLTRLVEETPVGRRVSVLIVRAGEQVRLDVAPEEGPSFLASVEQWVPDIDRLRQEYRNVLPDIDGDVRFHVERNFFGRGRRLGIGVSALGPQLAEYFEVDAGVLVTSVDADSVAASAGLRAGDVVTAIDGRPVTDAGELRDIVAGIEPPATLAITVSRDGTEVTLEARFEEEVERPRRRPRRI